MNIKYIVKSEKTPHMYLVADAMLGNREVPFAFKPCHQIVYEVAEFETKEDALAACEEAAKYYDVAMYVPVILETIS